MISERDYSQGGGSSVNSRAEWIQAPRCRNGDDAVAGKISADGKTVDFTCTTTKTGAMNNGTYTQTFTVSGTLVFRDLPGG